jgi:hypothetical protein
LSSHELFVFFPFRYRNWLGKPLELKLLFYYNVITFLKGTKSEERVDDWATPSNIYIYIYTSRKPVRCTEKLLKIKSKLILIPFTSFVEGQGLVTNQFVACLL